MKKFLETIVCILLVNALHAQFSIQGKVIDKGNQPLSGVNVAIHYLNQQQFIITALDGSFMIKNLRSAPQYTINFQLLGKKRQSLQLSAEQMHQFLTVEMVDEIYFLEPLEIKSTRALERAPFTKTNIDKQYLEKINLGQDIPFILQQTPSVVVSSDAGNGIGYTGIRIRGTDATRINVTINGIPYNDAESQGSFFVDLPDLTSSVNSIQVQRGVGTSTNGAGAFGATINLSTNEVNDKAYAESNNSYGSFNTWKNTIKAGSGLINNHFTVDMRLSRITSDGYIDRASSNLQSYFLSTAYLSNKTSLRFNTFSGTEKTYQAWNGVPEIFLQTNRTYNSSGTEKPDAPYDNEIDHFTQTHYQLFFNQSLNKNLSFNIAGFLTRGLGYYEQYKSEENYADYGLPDFITPNKDTLTQTDLVRQLWLDNYFYGNIFSLHYKKNNDQLTIGGGWNKFDNKHYGKIIWAEAGIAKDYTWYNLKANKTDFNIYAKWLKTITPNLDVFTDVQYRYVEYNMYGFRNNPALLIEREFNFINPKVGLSFHKNGWKAYISYALANKEPNRDDFEAGQYQQPKHETLHDFETGIEKTNKNFSYAVTGYYMFYKNQLILTGKINDVGAYTRINVPNSYRLGAELQGTIVIKKWLDVSANLTLSSNKIASFTEYIDDYDNNKQEVIQHVNTGIAFSPSITAGGNVNFKPLANLECSLLHKYIGEQFLDNTENHNRSLRPYFLQDLQVNYTVKNRLFNSVVVKVQLNNIWNKKYEPNGYTYSYMAGGSLNTENFYYPMAGTNFMLGLNLSF